jgi:hypothetical protein
MALLDTISTNYFSGQGDILIAKRSAAGNPGAFFLVGNAPKFEVTPSIERREHQESRSGHRLTDKVQSTTKGGQLSITLEDIRKDNLALLLSGSKVVLAAGSFTAGSPDTFPSGLVVGSIAKLARPNASSIVIKDSAGTPATLTAGTHYRVLDAALGWVEILNLASFVQPFKAEYSYGLTDAVTAMTANDDDEYWVSLAGINTEGSPDQKIGFHIFRVVFDAADVLSLINAEQGSFDLSGRILRDEARSADANFGGFARWEYVTPNA